ncbi:hypothetical protein TNCV_2275411 [Trichonephila clavipes]|nr:hypothetical protein TNCV_2275411 [Trichonephila clavipes]
MPTSSVYGVVPQINGVGSLQHRSRKCVYRQLGSIQHRSRWCVYRQLSSPNTEHTPNIYSHLEIHKDEVETALNITRSRHHGTNTERVAVDWLHIAERREQKAETAISRSRHLWATGRHGILGGGWR